MFSTKKQSDLYLNKLFSNVDEKKVKFNFLSNNIITINEGEIIFKKDEKSNFIYLILEGEIKLKVPNPPFSPKIVHKYKNEFFGEKELLENKPRVSACVAETDCQLYKISTRELQKLINENRGVRDNLEMVTISTEGKTLKEITEEKGTIEEKIDFSKANKVHPEKPITNPLVENIDSKEITLENIFKTDEITSEDIFIEKTDKGKPDKQSEIKKVETEEKEISKEIIEEKKQTEEIKKEETLPEESTDKKITQQVTEEDQPIEPTKELEPEETEAISEVKYLQIIDSSLALFKKTNLDDLILEITKQATELVSADRSVLFFTNEDEKLLKAKIKKDDNGFIDLKVPSNKSIVGICALRNKTVIIDDVSSDDRFNPIYDEVFDYKTKNLLIMPITDKDENVFSVLELINSNEENFTEIDIEILKIFSKSIILSLNNCENINKIISETSDKSLSKVSKYIYNDIKNPLLTIKNYAKILSKDELPEDIKQVLQLIIKQTNFVDALSGNLSTFNEDKINLKLREYSFKEIMNDILSLLAEYTDSRNVELFKKIENDAKVKIDPKQFMVACYQIIKNSCDAQVEKGAVFITSNIKEGKIEVEFKDSGEGISKELEDKILNKFTSFKDDSNYGVGLNIAEKIIKAHNGELSFSNSEEGGAVLTISLPIIYS